jgi:hypothetical protein
MLGVSSYHVRRLCEAELILAEFTGHEWLIPASEIDRLMKNGVPDIPAADPNAGLIGNTVKHGSKRNRVDSEQGSDPYGLPARRRQSLKPTPKRIKEKLPWKQVS